MMVMFLVRLFFLMLFAMLLFLFVVFWLAFVVFFMAMFWLVMMLVTIIFLLWTIWKIGFIIFQWLIVSFRGPSVFLSFSSTFVFLHWVNFKVKSNSFHALLIFWAFIIIALIRPIVLETICIVSYSIIRMQRLSKFQLICAESILQDLFTLVINFSLPFFDKKLFLVQFFSL